MLGPQVDQLERQILQALPRAEDLDAAVKVVVQGLDNLLPRLSTTFAAEISEAPEHVERQFDDIEILHNHSVLRSRPRWYFGPKPSDRHWPAVREFLLTAKGWAERDVDSIHEASN